MSLSQAMRPCSAFASAALPSLAGQSPAAAAGARQSQAQPAFACSKLKLDQLFLQWLALPEAQQLVRCHSATPFCVHVHS